MIEKTKEKRIFVPSRVKVSLLDTVNAKRKQDDMPWPELIEHLFLAYLKHGAKVWMRKA